METEEDTRARMLDFQQRLDNLKAPPTSDSVERLSKEMELQRGIDDILIKYREAQQAKWVNFQTVMVGVLSLVGGWVFNSITKRTRAGGSERR